MQEYNDLLSGDFKFLDKKISMAGNKITLASWPRSGNSFTRKIIESASGVFSGSDMLVYYSMCLQ